MNYFECLPAARSIVRVLAVAACLAPPPAAAAPEFTPEQAFSAGQFASAQQAYAAEVHAAPTDTTAQIGLIRSLLRLDHWDEALAQAQAFAALVPASGDAHGLLALALIRAGWQEPYADEAKKSLALDSQNYWGLMASGRAANWDDKTPEARRLFRQASALHPELPDAWLGLLETFGDDTDAAEKQAVAEKYLMLNPHGQPFDRMNEGLQDFRTNAAQYRRSFDSDPPFQQVASKGDTEAANPAVLKVDFEEDWAIFPVTVDGQKFRLLFDTGAGDLLLSKSAAKKLKLPVLAHSYLYGVNGRAATDVLKAGTMTLGALHYQSIPVRTISSALGNNDGLLGGSTLDDCVITLDYTSSTATLCSAKTAAAPLPLPGNHVLALPFHVSKDHLFLSVLVNGHPAWAMLDTGAQQTLFSLRFAKAQLRDVPKDEYHTGTFQETTGLGNSDRHLDYVYSRDQSIITLSQDPPVSVEADTFGNTALDRHFSPDYDFEVGLFFGASSFTYARRVTFDYPRHLLTFEYADPDAAPKTNSGKRKQ